MLGSRTSRLRSSWLLLKLGASGFGGRRPSTMAIQKYGVTKRINGKTRLEANQFFPHGATVVYRLSFSVSIFMLHLARPPRGFL